MNLVENLVDEIAWRYKVGKIDSINAETIISTTEDIYPHLDPEKGSEVAFQAAMKLYGNKNIVLL